jgi:hypothetical protein
MRTPIPVAGVVGFAASAGAIGLWTAERLTGQEVFGFLAVPFKLAILAAPLFFLSDLSSLLHRRPRVAFGLGCALVAVTLCTMAAYLPWRSSFAEHFNNAEFRWYYVGMTAREGDYPVWATRWSLRIPHMIEAGLVMVYYLAVMMTCTAWRLRRVGGVVVGVVGYLVLFLVPVLTGIILWDYDTFLKGIAFDSISMDLLPMSVWRPGSYSIFLYSFMLIFFGVSAIFFLSSPRMGRRAEVTS